MTVTRSKNAGSRKRIPAYQRIQRSIRALIGAGRLKTGDTVASERELARSHDVSLMTARHALAGLEREGVVERRRGAGTFVAPPRIHFNKLMSYTEQMRVRGLAVSSHVIAAKIIDSEPEIAARLNLSESSPIFKLQRVRLAADEPFAIETCYLPAEKFAGLEHEPLETSLFAILERSYGLHLTYADEEVEATAADARVSKSLNVPRGSPVMRIRQAIYSSGNEPTIYVVGFYRAERHSLFIRRFR